MSEQRITPNSRIAQALWWGTAAVIVCVVAILVWGGLYATRRAWALQQLEADGGDVQLFPPTFTPAWAQPRLPTWAYVIGQVQGQSRGRWQALAAFPEVQSVQFWGPGLTDADLRLLPRMRHLRSLTLDDEPGITDAGISYMEGSPQLSEVWLSNVELSDLGLQSIARIPKLEVFHLQNSRVTGSGLAALAQAKHLRSLGIEIHVGPAISLEALERLESLEDLELSGSAVTPDALRHLRLPPRLKVLGLSGPELNDALVDDLPEIVAAVPGIERVETLHFSGGLISNFTLEQIGERLGMVEKSGTFRRPSPGKHGR